MDSDVENEEPVIMENGKRRQQTEVQYSSKSTKRQKTNSTSDSALVDHNVDPLLAPIAIRYRRVLKHIPQDIAYMPITTETGSRVYLRIIEKKSKSLEEEEEDKHLLTSTKGGSNRKLFNDWDRIKEEARVLKDKFHRNLARIVENENVIEGLGVSKEKSGAEESLWVEKYKPRSYMDLLSEEGVNKLLLHWLKLWDKAVFGNDYLSKVKLTKDKYAKLEAKEKERAEKDKKFHTRQPLAVEEEYDDMGRPKVKIALLYGPPGLGKTTCAHVVGKHAGYSIREMNASDDRSVDIFRKVLDDATQSRSEIFQDGRPNCLIIDEIDGAPVATVNVLIDLITGNATEKGKKKIKKVLKRPVICICNDLYAPSLKELKKHALVLQFNPVTVASLAERLREISTSEHLNLDNGTLQSLCEKSDCDIRSCLSTLQFLKKKKCTPKDALFAQVGMKDKAKGIFAVWQDIFTIPDGKKYYDTEDPTKSDVRFRSVLRVVQNFGEYEKLLGGVFENYLKVKYRDCYLESIIEGLSWTTWFEEMNQSIEQHQNFVLMGYLPMYFVVSHFLFGQRGWVKLNFPSNEISARTPRNRSIINSVLTDITPSVGRYLDSYGMVSDLFPALTSIIQPATIRPVPTQIWSARERETLRNVVEIMIVYNLCYTQVKNPETGSYNFILEPDIETVAKFKIPDPTGSKRTFPYAIKQLIAREIDTEKLRRSDPTPGMEPIPEAQPPSNSKIEFKVPQPLAKMVPAKKFSVDLSANMTKDFFGRLVAPSAQNTQDLLAQQRRASGICFRFKEGYSNAVRRFVKMKDLE